MNTTLRWVIGVLLTILLAGSSAIIGAWNKTSKIEVEKIVENTIDYPWTHDKPLVERFMRKTDKALADIDLRQRVQGLNIKGIDTTVKLIYDKVKDK